MENPENMSLSLEELALMLRKAADNIWEEAEDWHTTQKIIASDVHELAAKLQRLHATLQSHRRAAGLHAPASA